MAKDLILELKSRVQLIMRIFHPDLGNHNVLLVMWILWVAFEKFAFGPWSQVRIFDEADSVLAVRQAQAWPPDFIFGTGWWPQAAGGLDTLANSYDPKALSILFAIFPDWLGASLYMIVLIAMSVIFAYKLAKDVLAIDRPWAVLGAIVLTALFVLKIMPRETVAPTLFAVWYLSVVPTDRRWGIAKAFIFGVLFAKFTSYTQMIYAVAVVIGWFIVVVPRGQPAFIRIIVSFVMGFALISIPGIWAGISNAEHSHRIATTWSHEDFSTLFLYYLKTRAIDLALGCVCALGLMVSAKSEPRHLRLFIFWAGVLLVYVVSHLANHFADHFGPLAGLFRAVVPKLEPHTSWLSALCFASGIHLLTARFFAGLSEHLLSRYRSFVYIAAIFTLFVSTISDKKQNLWGMLHGDTFATVYMHPDMTDLALATRSDDPFRVATIMSFRPGNPLLQGAFGWRHGFETADGYLNLYPQRYRDIWEKVLDPLWKSYPSASARHRNYVVLDQPPGLAWEFCKPRSIQDCLLNIEEFYNVEILSLLNVRFLISPFPIKGPGLKLMDSAHRKRLLELENQPVVRSKWRANLSGQYGLGPAMYIYENLRVLPRFFLAHTAKVVSPGQRTIDVVANHSSSVLRHTAFIEPGATVESFTAPVERPAGSVKVETYTQDHIALSTTSSHQSILIVTNNYNKHWRVCIDGQRDSLVLVNHAFQGIHLPAGQHKVTLSYQPPYLYWSRRDCSGDDGARTK